MQPERDPLMEPIFELPEEVIRHAGLRAMYFQLVETMRRQIDAAGLGQDPSANMLAERCAFRYVTLRQKEMRLNGMGYVGNQEVTLNKLWVEFQREFILLVRTAPKSQDELWQKMQDIIYGVVEGQDKAVQRKLVKDFSSAFEREKVK